MFDKNSKLLVSFIVVNLIDLSTAGIFQVPFEEIRPSNTAVIELNTASLRKGIKKVFEVGAHFRRLKREDQQKMAMMRNGGVQVGSAGSDVNHDSVRC